MNLKTFELAKRAVTCKNWKWMAGMLAVRIPQPPFVQDRRHRVYEVTNIGLIRCSEDTFHYDNVCFWPDFTDPATIGCLLDLVRKAWPIAPANVNHHGAYSPEKGHYHFWSCSYCTGEKWEQAHGETEAEALVIALEASNV